MQARPARSPVHSRRFFAIVRLWKRVKSRFRRTHNTTRVYIENDRARVTSTCLHDPHVKSKTAPCPPPKPIRIIATKLSSSSLLLSLKLPTISRERVYRNAISFLLRIILLFSFLARSVSFPNFILANRSLPLIPRIKIRFNQGFD